MRKYSLHDHPSQGLEFNEGRSGDEIYEKVGYWAVK